MQNFISWAKNEVAAISGLVIAVLAMLPLFGVALSAEQNASIVGCTAILLGFVTRKNVTSGKGLADRDAAVGEYLKAAEANK
jgi:hypothetical protein